MLDRTGHKESDERYAVVENKGDARRLADILPGAALAVVVSYIAIRSFAEAMGRPFWYDEVSTWTLSEQGGLRAIWRILSTAADGQPPAYYLLVRLCGSWVSTPEIAARIPSIIAFCATLVCMFLIARRHTSSLTALLSSLLLIPTPLYHHYSGEARPYALVVALAAFALLCYEHAPKPGWMLCFGISLFLGEAFHYYGFFVTVPFLTAEFILAIRERRIRTVVWIAMAAGFIPLAIYWPLLVRLRSYFGQSVVSQHDFLEAIKDYGAFFHANNAEFSFIILGVPLLSLITATLVTIRRRPANRVPNWRSPNPVLAVCFIFLPLLMFAAVRLAHGSFWYRYALVGILGFPLTVISLSVPKRSRVATRTATALMAVILLVAWIQESIYYRGASEWHLLNPGDRAESLVSETGYIHLPVMVSRAADFLPLSYYARGEFRDRLFRPADPAQALLYTGTDSADLQLLSIGKVLGLREPRLSDVAATHAEFLLYSTSEEWDPEWWSKVLTNDGYVLRQLVVSGARTVFLVQRPAD